MTRAVFTEPDAEAFRSAVRERHAMFEPDGAIPEGIPVAQSSASDVAVEFVKLVAGAAGKVPDGQFDGPLFCLREPPQQVIVAYGPLSDAMVKYMTKVTKTRLKATKTTEARMVGRGIR